MTHQTVLVLDFGSQYTQLIARCLRELSVYSEILPFDTSVEALREHNPVGIILSGGPSSVSDDGAPQCAPALFELGVPTLGICYGMQVMASTLGGQVARAPEREYGNATVTVTGDGPLLANLPSELRVWASHGDFVESPPQGFEVRATSANAPVAAMEDQTRHFYALLFHPEVVHTEHGTDILRNFAYSICGCAGDWTMASFVQETTTRIRDTVGDSAKVVCGLSGGVDSTVAALLVQLAIGDRLTCIFVDNGVLRLDEARQIEQRYVDKLHLQVVYEDASDLFLQRLSGVTDPERKRRVIGTTFIEVFEASAAKLGQVDYLVQGTLYPDVIESVSVVGPSAAIKSHHNVGGLPDALRFELIEPLRELFKDEVRAVGAELGLDDEFVWRQPFPGPGLAVRILGEVTRARVELLQKAGRDRRRRDSACWTVSAGVAVVLRAPAGPKRRCDGGRAYLREHHRRSSRRKP